MATHKLEYYFEVEFDDGTRKELPWPDDRVYHFAAQKSTYLINWLETLIKKEKITAKPLFIREMYKVIESEEYQTVIGL